MTVADRIKAKRLELGLSQEELARRANYSDKTAISKFEHSGNEITMKQIRRVAEALGVTDAYLMGFEEIEKAGKELARQIKPVTDALKPISEELKKLTPQHINTDYYIKTDKGYTALIETLSEKYDEQQIKRALEFVKAFLSATPERQKIAIEILQSHQSDS